MVTMIDELFDRQYRAGRDQLNSAIVGFFRSTSEAILNPFRVLNRIEYSAPWTIKQKQARPH